jgi:hypothetical protein
MPDLGLKVTSSLGLLELTFTESFGFMLHGGHHCELTVSSVVVVKFIFVHDKMQVDAIWLVHNEAILIFTVIGGANLLAHVN